MVGASEQKSPPPSHVPGKAHQSVSTNGEFYHESAYEAITLIWAITAIVFVDFIKERVCNWLLINLFYPLIKWTQKFYDYFGEKE